MTVTGDLVYIVGLLALVTDEDIMGSAIISAQRLTKWSNGHSYRDLL